MFYNLERKGNHRLIGVWKSRNSEADDLQEYAGFKFQAVPDKVDLRNPYNRVALALQLLRPDAFMPALRLNLQLFRPKTLGLWVPDFGAYVTRTGDPFVGRHENTHGYIEERNPQIRLRSEAIMFGSTRALMGKIMGGLDIELAATYHSFNEGFSNWIAIRVALLKGDPKEVETATKYHNKLMANSEDGNHPTSSTMFAVSKFKVARTAVKNIKDQLQGSGKYIDSLGGVSNRTKAQIAMDATKRNFRVVLPSKIAILDASYFVGYFFSEGFMNEALRRGSSIAEAADLVIANPPSKMSDLRNPGGYFKELTR